MAETWNRAIIINLSLPLTLTTQDNCCLSYSTNPDWSHSHLNSANSGCQKLRLIGPRDALPCLLSSDNGMGTALMPQLCSGNPRSKGSLGWLNKCSSPRPKVPQIHPNAGEALAVLRRWQIPPSFPLEPTSPALFTVGCSFGYLTHSSGWVLWRLVVWVTDLKVFAPFLCHFIGFPRSLFVDFHHTFSIKPQKFLFPLLFFLSPLAYFLLSLFLRCTLCSAWI